MALTQLTASTAIIAALADLPNATSGLTAAQLKAKFDEAPTSIKTYINSTLLAELAAVTDGDSGADNIGATAISGLTGANVQALLESLKNKYDGLNPVSGYVNAKDYGVLGDGATNDYAALNTLFNTTLTTATNVVMPTGTYISNTNLTIPSYINLIMLNGAKLSPAISTTVTINGNIDAGLYQIFTGAGTIAGTPRIEKVVPQWWGAVADGNYGTGAGTDNTSAFQKAISFLSVSGGSSLVIPSGIYKLVSQITVPSGISIIGYGKWSSILFCPTAFASLTGLIAINGTGGYPTNIKGIGVLAQTGGSNGSGIVSTKNGVFISDVWINGFTVGAASRGIDINSTDNFIYDFAVEDCKYGIHVQSSHVNIENGTIYECTIGGTVANNATTEAGETTFVNVRANSCPQIGFDVSGGKNVTFTACSVSNEDAAKFTTAGLNINASSNVKVNGFTARIDNADHTTGVGILIVSSSNISIVGGEITNFYDGLNATSPTNLTINGLQTISNGRNGIISAGGDAVLINAVISQGNGGAGTADSGVHITNTAGYAIYSVTNCICTQAGGGVQEYGIYASLTDNGAATGTINLVGNICMFNGTTNISENGLVARITDYGNVVS